MNPRKRRTSVTKEQFWRQHIEAWRTGGQSVRAYCSAEELSEPSFYAWRRELAGRDSPRAKKPRRAAPAVVPQPASRNGSSASAAWIELQLRPAPGAEAPIEIELPGGKLVRLRGAAAQQALAEILAALEGRPC